MEISSHIKDLLLTNDMVILSGFGAFVAKYKPAAFDSQTNTMSPPSRDIVFDSFITNGTGLLEQKMSEREKISTTDAAAQIEEYVKTIKSKLKAGKKVIFKDLGSFTSIKEGVVLFSYEPAANLLLDSYGLTEISLNNAKSGKGAKKTVIKQSPKKEVANQTDKTSKKKPIGLIILLAAVVLIAAGIFAIYKFKNDWWVGSNTYITALYQKTFNSKDSLKTDLKDIKNNKDSVLNKENKEIIKDTTKSDSLEIITVDTSSVSKETVAKDENLNKENKADNKKDNKKDNSNNTSNNNVNPDTDGTIAAQKGKYYLIAGSVLTLDAAKKEKVKFEKKGIPVFILPADGKFRITIGEYETQKEAISTHDSFTNSNPAIELWLWQAK